MSGILSSWWGHIKFHSKNIVLLVAGVFFVGALFGWLCRLISIVDFLNIALVASLVGVTSLYAKATDRLVELNSALIEESRKSRRREYLEKKLEKIYIPLYEYLVRGGSKYINDDKTGQFLSSEIGLIFKTNIKYHLYLADENLRELLRKILESDGKHRVSKNTFDEAKELIQEGVHKYTNELEEITK